MSNVVEKLVAAMGGAAVGVGGTLLVQKLRKDAVEENKSEILTGLAEKIDEAADRVMAKQAEEPAENIAYRKAAAAAAETPPKKTVVNKTINKSAPAAEALPTDK